MGEKFILIKIVNNEETGEEHLNVEWQEGLRDFEAFNACMIAAKVIESTLVRRSQAKQSSNIIVPDFRRPRGQN